WYSTRPAALARAGMLTPRNAGGSVVKSSGNVVRISMRSGRCGRPAPGSAPIDSDTRSLRRRFALGGGAGRGGLGPLGLEGLAVLDALVALGDQLLIVDDVVPDEQVEDGLGGLGALADPVLHALGVDLDGLALFLRQRVVPAEFL